MEPGEDALSTLFGSQFKKMNLKNKHIHIYKSTYTIHTSTSTKINIYIYIVYIRTLLNWADLNTDQIFDDIKELLSIFYM